MNKTEFIDALAAHMSTGRAEAEKALNAFTEVVTNSLQSGEDVNITGFGAFSVTHRAARMGVNPQTGEKIQVAASKSPKFKAGKALKDAVKNSGESSDTNTDNSSSDEGSQVSAGQF